MDNKMEQKQPKHKGIYILPNLFTVGSIFAAFIGLIFAHKGAYDYCAYAIFISAILDGMDGKVARLTGSTSEFGVQMDSLADAIAFGLTPAYLAYLWQLHTFSNLGIAIAFFFCTCGVLRLARFNVMTTKISKKFFMGLPIPAGGCGLAFIVLFGYSKSNLFGDAMPVFALIMTFVLGLLMVSRVRYFAFKDFSGLNARPFTLLVAAVILLVPFIMSPLIMGFVYFLAYIFSGLIYTIFFFRRPTAASVTDRKVEIKNADSTQDKNE